MPNPVPRVQLICAECQQPFERMACQLTRGRGRYCSVDCRGRSMQRRVSLTCAQCGNQFSRKQSEIDKSIRLYGPPKNGWSCSRACYEAGRRLEATSYPKISGRHAHRVVAEEVILRRPLKEGEIVHHRDGDKRNFSPDNLKVIENQTAHARGHCPPGMRIGSAEWRRHNRLPERENAG